MIGIDPEDSQFLVETNLPTPDFLTASMGIWNLAESTNLWILWEYADFISWEYGNITGKQVEGPWGLR